MDIVQLLIQDHERLRKEMVEIEAGLSWGGGRRAIKKFIARFELHESVEEEILFGELNEIVSRQTDGDFVFEYEKDHTKIWALLDRLLISVDAGDSRAAAKAFQRFTKFLALHMNEEERVLLPTVRKLVCPQTLQELGARAEHAFRKFEAQKNGRKTREATLY